MGDGSGRAYLDDCVEVGEAGDVLPLDGARGGLPRRGQQIQAPQLLHNLGLHRGMLAHSVHHPGSCMAGRCTAGQPQRHVFGFKQRLSHMHASDSCMRAMQGLNSSVPKQACAEMSGLMKKL